MTERERKYVAVTSEPYLLITDGNAVVSGIEHVGEEPNDRMRVSLPPGRWSVMIHLIDWEAEPGQADDAGRPAPTALPDFAILINPEGQANRDYRTRVQTFER